MCEWTCSALQSGLGRSRCDRVGGLTRDMSTRGGGLFANASRGVIGETMRLNDKLLGKGGARVLGKARQEGNWETGSGKLSELE